MKDQTNTAPQQQQAQEGPRLPKISPQLFQALNELDQFVGRAPLSRQEHAVAQNHLQTLVRATEELEQAIPQLQATIKDQAEELGRLRAEVLAHAGVAANSDVVREVSREVFNKEKGAAAK